MAHLQNGRAMCRFPGVPPNHMPNWRYFSLDCKLPIPSLLPEGAVTLYPTEEIGDPVWKTYDCLDFDRYDQNMYQPPVASFNSLRDTHIRGYMANTRVLKHLYNQGLITRDGKVPSSLADFNRYRRYLHRLNIDRIMTKENMDEEADVKELMFTTLRDVKQRRSELAAYGHENSYSLKIQYSEILRDEAGNVRRSGDDEFNNSEIMKTNCEGERKFILKLRKMLQEEHRKKALIRLRRLQRYDENQMKGWDRWRKHSWVQLQERAAEIIRERDLRNERNKHVQEHKEVTACQRAKVEEAIRNMSDEMRNRNLWEGREIQKRICLLSHRQDPLSARCPPRVLEGGSYDEECPYTSLIHQLENELYCEDTKYAKKINAYIAGQIIKPAMNRYKEAQNFPPHDGDFNSGYEAENPEKNVQSLESKYTDAIIRNALDLIFKHLRVPRPCKAYKVPQAQLPKLKHFLEELSNELKEEMTALLANGSKILNVLINSLKQAEVLEGEKALASCGPDEEAKEPHERSADWGGSPLLRTNSQTLTGRYVRDQLAKVSKKLRCDGLLLDDEVDVQNRILEKRMQDAIMEVASRRSVYDLNLHLLNAEDLIEMTKMLVDHSMPLEGDREELMVGLVTSLLRTTLIKFKDTLECSYLKVTDLNALASTVHMDSMMHSVWRHMTLEGLVDRYTEELICSKGVSSLICDAVKKINSETGQTVSSEDNVQYHISAAARRFITKIIDNIFDDCRDKKPRKDKAKDKARNRTCNNVNINCQKSDSEGSIDGAQKIFMEEFQAMSKSEVIGWNEVPSMEDLLDGKDYEKMVEDFKSFASKVVDAQSEATVEYAKLGRVLEGAQRNASEAGRDATQASPAGKDVIRAGKDVSQRLSIEFGGLVEESTTKLKKKVSKAAKKRWND